MMRDIYKEYFPGLGISFFLLFLLPFVLFSQNQECFLLMVGKDASASGQVFLAHNNDLSGKEASMLLKVPAGKEINILPDHSLSFPKSFNMLILQTEVGFAEGDAVAVNENGVSIAGGMSLKKDRNSNAERIDPLIPAGLGGGIRYFALQHAGTARECVKIIGECYNMFGIKYPGGVGIADTNEIWYLEAGGGHSWAAVRIPDNCYFAGANSYRIGTIDFDDTANYMYSPNLQELYGKYVLQDNPGSNFSFREFFGNGVKEKTGNNYYNTRRLWRAMDILTPSLHLSPDEEDFPLSVPPDEKIGFQTCTVILRDYYAGTPFDIFRNINRDHPERSIAVWECVHTDVITLTPGKPADWGYVIWTGMSSPFTAVYVPVYFGVSFLPRGFDISSEVSGNLQAFQLFKTLGDISRSDYPVLMNNYLRRRKIFENEELTLQQFIIDKAQKLHEESPDNLGSFLANFSNEYAFRALTLVKEMIDSLQAGYKKTPASK